MLKNFKPWMLIPPKWAHDLSPFLLPLITPVIARLKQNPEPHWQSRTWRGLHFRNPLGLAGGVDKNADSLESWWNLGAGFIEVGTVTPRPQKANPGKIMDRDLKLQALWNKMGFPSEGADEVYYNLRALKHSLGAYPTPVFVNIGKNRDTPNDEAHLDYLFLLERLHVVADAFVINISSPNTKGLRELQNPEALALLLSPLIKKAQLYKKPLLLKLSPDMDVELLRQTLLTAAQLGIDGFVLTNTTLSRPADCHFPTEGGLSGAPLKDLSLASLKIAAEVLGKMNKDLLIVSCGGILSPDDVFERLQLGADLVEIYSALVLEGPQFFGDVASKAKE